MQKKIYVAGMLDEKGEESVNQAVSAITGVTSCTASFKKVIHGEFGADMQINLTNDGPVTIILDTDEWKAQ